MPERVLSRRFCGGRRETLFKTRQLRARSVSFHAHAHAYPQAFRLPTNSTGARTLSSPSPLARALARVSTRAFPTPPPSREIKTIASRAYDDVTRSRRGGRADGRAARRATRLRASPRANRARDGRSRRFSARGDAFARSRARRGAVTARADHARHPAVHAKTSFLARRGGGREVARAVARAAASKSAAANRLASLVPRVPVRRRRVRATRRARGAPARARPLVVRVCGARVKSFYLLSSHPVTIDDRAPGTEALTPPSIHTPTPTPTPTHPAATMAPTKCKTPSAPAITKTIVASLLEDSLKKKDEDARVAAAKKIKELVDAATTADEPACVELLTIAITLAGDNKSKNVRAAARRGGEVVPGRSSPSSRSARASSPSSPASSRSSGNPRWRRCGSSTTSWRATRRRSPRASRRSSRSSRRSWWTCATR